MTTTATKPTKPSASKRERELEEALAEVKAEHDEARQRAHEHRARVEELRRSSGSGRSAPTASSRAPASRGGSRRRARSPPR
jgi:hypothetical protein